MSEHFGQTLRDSIKPRNLCIGCVYARPRWVKRLSALPCKVSRFIRCMESRAPTTREPSPRGTTSSGLGPRLIPTDQLTHVEADESPAQAAVQRFCNGPARAREQPCPQMGWLCRHVEPDGGGPDASERGSRHRVRRRYDDVHSADAPHAGVRECAREDRRIVPEPTERRSPCGDC